jgi:hypothetical protein
MDLTMDLKRIDKGDRLRYFMELEEDFKFKNT